MSSTRQSKLPILAIGAIVLVAGGIGAYFAVKQVMKGTDSSPLTAAKLVPDDAVAAVYISGDTQAWKKLEAFGTPEAQKLVGDGLAKMNQELLTQSNVTFDQDIQPWLGGTMIAILPPNAVKPAQSLPNTPDAPNVLVVVGVKDKLAILNFSNKLKANKSLKQKEVDYKGQKITEISSENGDPGYISFSENHLVISDQRLLVEQSIDAAKGEPSFASKPNANTVLTQGMELQNPLVQFYLPDYGGLVKQALASTPQATPLSPDLLKQLEQVKSISGGIGVDDQGLRLKTNTIVDPKAGLLLTQSSPGKIVSLFPSETIALMSGYGIKQGWEAALKQADANPELKRGIDIMRGGTQVVNLDLDKDIFGWMDGEFGLAMMPVNQGMLASAGVGGALAFDTSDRKTAEAMFAKLDTLVKQQMVSPTPKEVGGKKVTDWQTPMGTVLTHGWLDQDTVFVAVGEPVVSAITTPKGAQLDASPAFQGITGSLPKPNGGYFYLDMEKVMPLIEKVSAQASPMPPESKAILSSIRGIGATASNPNTSTSQMEMILSLKPKAAQ
jgi:Protein of unknown function (DUF3352)